MQSDVDNRIRISQGNFKFFLKPFFKSRGDGKIKN